MKVYLVRDHEGYTVAVFVTRELAQAHIDGEFADVPETRRGPDDPYAWQIEEQELRGADA